MFFFPKTKWFSLSGLWQEIWSIVWNLSEFTHIGLGKYAPWVFCQMIGSKKMEKKSHVKNK